MSDDEKTLEWRRKTTSTYNSALRKCANFYVTVPGDYYSSDRGLWHPPKAGTQFEPGHRYDLDPSLDKSMYQPTKKMKQMRNLKRIQQSKVASNDTAKSQEKVESAMELTTAATKKAEAWSNIAADQDFECVHNWQGGVPLDIVWFASDEMQQKFKDKIVNMTETNFDWRAIIAWLCAHYPLPDHSGSQPVG